DGDEALDRREPRLSGGHAREHRGADRHATEAQEGAPIGSGRCHGEFSLRGARRATRDDVVAMVAREVASPGGACQLRASRVRAMVPPKILRRFSIGELPRTMLGVIQHVIRGRVVVNTAISVTLFTVVWYLASRFLFNPRLIPGPHDVAAAA